MPLTEASLSGKIETEMNTQFGAPDDSAKLKKFCDAVAKAVVDEIKANAVVSVTIPDAQAGTTPLPGSGTVS